MVYEYETPFPPKVTMARRLVNCGYCLNGDWRMALRMRRNWHKFRP